MNKKRVAICFFGQTRTFQTIEETYKNLSHDDIQFDFYVSTWDDFKDKEKFDFCTGKEFIDPNIIEFKNNTERASYTIHRLNIMKSTKEVKENFIYDYVMWVRSEIYFEIKPLLEFIESKVGKHKSLEINTHGGIEDKDGHPYLAGDYYFFGTSVAFDLYATGWKHYFKCNLEKNYGVHGGHNFHAKTIVRNNLDLVPVNIPHRFQFSKLHGREIS
tara:strand:- start:249 stop:896 length:648 start_codon:yes stop_codon:yes gene_type:complete